MVETRATPNDSDQRRGPSEDGVSDAGESPEDGRLPALRCGGWIGAFFSTVLHRPIIQNATAKTETMTIPKTQSARRSLFFSFSVRCLALPDPPNARLLTVSIISRIMSGAWILPPIVRGEPHAQWRRAFAAENKR